MTDLKKLDEIIASLEKQAEKVTEFNGVLSAVNAARTQIESSKDIFKSASDDHKRFSIDSRNKFDEINNSIVSIDEALKANGNLQVNLTEKILSDQRLGFIDSKNKCDGIDQSILLVNKTLETIHTSQVKSIDKILSDQKLNAIDTINKLEDISISLTSIESVLKDLGRVQFQIIGKISALDVLSPEAFKKGLNTTEKEVTSRLNKLEQYIESMGKAHQQQMKSMFMKIGFIVIGSSVATAIILALI